MLLEGAAFQIKPRLFDTSATVWQYNFHHCTYFTFITTLTKIALGQESSNEIGGDYDVFITSVQMS